MKKRMLAAALCLCMALTLLPVTAAGTGSTAETALLSGTAALSSEGSRRAISLGVKDVIGGRADSVFFGNYPQSDTSGKKKDPVEWWVLDNEGDELFLLSRFNLDAKKYNDRAGDITWENSTLRAWLNDAFLNRAFNTTEQGAISLTDVVNDKSFIGVSGGNNTRDKVFLLSAKEAVNSAYFQSDGYRMTQNTPYTAKQSSDMNRAGYSADNWWLRTPGHRADMAAYVADYVNSAPFDNVSEIGDYTHTRDKGVRPAIKLDLSKVLFVSAAGQALPSGGNTMAPVPEYDGRDWQVTLTNGSDPGVTVVSDDKGRTVKEGYTDWSFTVRWETGFGSSRNVQLLLVDENNEALYYSNLGSASMMSTVRASIQIPEGLKEGRYTLKVFKGTTYTDGRVNYASGFMDIPLEVVDGTPPVLEAVSAERDKLFDDMVKVSFTCSEWGTLYYKVQKSTEQEPSFDADTWEYGGPCHSGDSNHGEVWNVKQVSYDQKIYLVAVDWAGNVSNREHVDWRKEKEPESGSWSGGMTTLLAAPGDPRWDSSVMERATWDQVTYEVWSETYPVTDYAVQLYKGGTAVGDPVTVTGTEHIFAMEEAGTYHFTVKAVVEGSGFGALTATSGELTICGVTFVAGDGDSDTTTQLVRKGGTVERPADPSRGDAQFGGWYTDKGCTRAYDFASAVNESITLYAKWTRTGTTAHEHSYDENTWSKNASWHWKQCTDGECPDMQESIKDTAAHDFSGENESVCSKCGYEKQPVTRPDPDPEPGPEPEPEHEHSYGEWRTNEGYHWQECTDPNCTDRVGSRFGAEEHDFGDMVAAGTNPSCTVCGYEIEGPSLDGGGTGGTGEPGGTGESHVHVCSYDTWNRDSVYHWKECAGAYCPNVDVVQEQGEHSYGAWYVKEPATTAAAGVEARECMTEGCGYTQTREIPRREPERYYYNSGSTDGGGENTAPEKVSAPKTADAGVAVYALSGVLGLGGLVFAGRKRRK